MFHDLCVKTVLTYIENRVSQPISLDALAKLTGYSRDHLRSVFKKNTGESVARYVRGRRLSHAAFALVNTNREITDIALSLGFASHDAFTRAFRERFGCTPSAFRCSEVVVKGLPIIPGIIAPMVFREEEQSMNQIASEGSVILYGVPKVSYFNDPPELTPFISSLHACLTYAGQRISYARLLAASGAAFRLMWNTERLDGGNVDIMVMRENPMEPVARAFAAAGRSYTHIARSGDPNNRADMIALIRREIDAGRPLIAFGIIGPPEACVITGYRDDGDTLLGWSFFQDFPEWKGSLSTEPCGYFARKGWYEHPMTLGIMAVGEAGPVPDELTLLKDTVRFAIEVMSTQRVGARAGSAAAFDAWASVIEDDAQFPKGASLPMLMERCMCQMDAFTMVSEGRWCAENYFEEVIHLLPALMQPLQVAVAAFRKVRERCMCMVEPMGGLGMGEQQARALAIKENRLAIAQIIHDCKQLDRQARTALEQLSAQTLAL